MPNNKKITLLVHIKDKIGSRDVSVDEFPAVFGRDPINSDVHVDGTYVSKYHFKVLLDNNRLKVVDTSKNGTFVNQAPLFEKYLKSTTLKKHDQIQLAGMKSNNSDFPIIKVIQIKTETISSSRGQSTHTPLADRNDNKETIKKQSDKKSVISRKIGNNSLVIREGRRTYSISRNELTELGTGGTAKVYFYKKKHQAIKLYHQDILAKHRHEYYQKLEAMLGQVPRNITFIINKKTYTQFAWPQALVEDNNGRLLGYVMPALPNTEIYQLTDYIKEVTSLDAKHHSITYRIQVALNLASAVSNLHKAGHYFIDMKTQNIFVFKDSSTVCFIDCDGFAIDKGRFKAQHFTRCYQVPDALRNNYGPTELSDKPYQDYYCLAHLIFEILDFNNQPFKGVLNNPDIMPDGEDTYDFKVKNGLYPYGVNPHPDIKPFPSSTYQYWPKSLRQLFEKAFTGSSSEIPNASVWVKELKSHVDKKNFEKCSVEPNLRHHDHFKGTRCFACDVFENKNNPNLDVNENISLDGLSVSQRYASDILSASVNINEDLLSDDENDWQNADKVNSVEVYRQYISNHPQGKYIKSAKIRIKAALDKKAI